MRRGNALSVLKNPILRPALRVETRTGIEREGISRDTDS
jgi:hypothetical protein